MIDRFRSSGIQPRSPRRRGFHALHIAFCSPHWPPARAANGIVSYVAAVRDHFISEGHRVSVISEGRLFSSEGTDTHLDAAEGNGALEAIKRRVGRRIDAWFGQMPCTGRSVAAQVLAAQRHAPIDILEMEESFGWSGIVQRATGIPTVTRLHGPYFLKPNPFPGAEQGRAVRERSRAEGRAIRSALMLTAPTHATMDASCAEYGRTPSGLTAVVPNPIPVAPADRRWRLDTCEHDHILVVGRFDYIKGADTALKAFEQLLVRRPAARLTFVGPDIGIETTPGRAVGYKDWADENLSPLARQRVTFAGQLPPDRIAALRLRANVAVVPSRWENFPYSLLEGLSLGCPTISTDWPGSDEIVRHRETGLLTPVGEAEPLANALDWLLAQPDEAGRLAERSWRHCAERFSIAVVGKELLECYERALAAGRKC